MMKRLVMIAVTGILFFALSGGSAKAENPPEFVVDGKAVTFNEELGFPYISETGRTMMPVRACLNAIGCQVEWINETKTVFAYNDKTQVDIPIGREEINVNQWPVPTDTAAVIKNERTYLPLRAVLEAFGYRVDWDQNTRIVYATSPEKLALAPDNINGGTTGVFSRNQLNYSGFAGIEGDITLPAVTLNDKTECPYVYFGFDWQSDTGNTEGGFQYICEEGNPDNGKWVIYLRQGSSWLWGENSIVEQGSTHHLKFYGDVVSDQQVDLVIELDGREVVRKASAVTDFSNASVKSVLAMAMTNVFNGTNCRSTSEGAKIENLKVLEWGADKYTDFDDYELYSEWKPAAGKGGMWFGTVDSIPSYLHYGENGSVSVYNERMLLEQKDLATPVAKREYGDTGNVTVTDQYIYYEDGDGQIIQAQLADPTVMKMVYQLPVWSYGDGVERVYGSLSVENGTPYLKYHQGGATMGSDFVIRLNDDGTTTQLQGSYTRSKTSGDKSFSYFTGGAPGPGNLFLKVGDDEHETLGNPDYLYGWAWKTEDDGSAGGSGSDDVYLIGDELYILAFENMYEKGNTTGIYRININTNETVRASDKEVYAFRVEGDYLFYHSGGTFYRQLVKDGKEEVIRQVTTESPIQSPPLFSQSDGIENFLVLNGKIYWKKNSDQILYDIDGNNLNEGAVLDSMAIMGDSGEYLVCTFEDTGSSYKIMVFDKDGKVAFTSYDKAFSRNISIFGDRIYFYNITTGTVCIGQLNQ